MFTSFPPKSKTSICFSYPNGYTLSTALHFNGHDYGHRTAVLTANTRLPILGTYCLSVVQGQKVIDRFDEHQSLTANKYFRPS